MMQRLALPVRYYRMYPPEAYLGYAEELLSLPLSETAFMLVDVYGLGYYPGEPEPARPALFYRNSTAVERAVIARPATEDPGGVSKRIR